MHIKNTEVTEATPNIYDIFGYNRERAKHKKPQKINKTIEIVIVPKLADIYAHQENVGIELDENLILNILSSRYQQVLVTIVKSQIDLDGLAARKPDLVFSGVKYFSFNGRDIWLNDYLDFHDIAYMASSRAALDSEYNKSNAKNIMQMANIATANYFTTEPGEHIAETSLPIAFPVFIKPVASGDSMGVDANSVVYDFQSFQSKVLDIHENQESRALVETYLSGKEYSVGILEDRLNGNLRAMPIEIIAEENENGHRILDFDIKFNDSEKVTAVTDIKIHKQLCDLAKAAFKALGGKSLGRIDIKLDSENKPHFIEANLMPGLRKGYFYRACSLNLDMNYEQMILTIADNGLSS